MPNFNGKIKGFAVGDDLEVYRTITNVPVGEPVVAAWFTAKVSFLDTDDAALIKKEITTTLDVSEGVIADDGAGGTAILRFFLKPADTAQLGNPERETAPYHYDIQVKTLSDRIYTPEIGKITGTDQVTFETT